MEIICAGLSRTGTTSLTAALKILGYEAWHYFDHFENSFQFWKSVYDGSAKDLDIVKHYESLEVKPDAVVDLPVCIFWEEFLEAYPDAKVILTTRDTDKWYESLESHVNHEEELMESVKGILGEAATLKAAAYAHLIHGVVYGSVNPNPILWKKKMKEHNDRVIAKCPPEKLLILPVDPSWESLCTFLGKSVPDVPYPELNQKGVFVENTLTRITSSKDMIRSLVGA